MSAPHKVEVVWSDAQGSQSSVKIPSGQEPALLDLCEDAGLDIPHGCRSGSCGSCRVQILEGGDLLAERSFLESDTLAYYRDAQDIRLACRTQLVAQVQAPSKKLVLKKAGDVSFEE